MRIPHAHPFPTDRRSERGRGSKVVKARLTKRKYCCCQHSGGRIACFLRSNSGRCQNQPPPATRFKFRNNGRRKRKRAFNVTTDRDRERDRQPLVGFGRVIVHTSHEENRGEEQRGRTQFVVNVPARERRVIFSGGNPPLPLHFLGFLGEDKHSPPVSRPLTLV